tara:strand:- start:1451 stop:1738 length:288 start_codon:yes stop_codon:yes gene_type:complete
MTNEKYSMVRVIWADAHTSESGWLDMSEQTDDGEVLVHTVGYLIPVGDAGSKARHVSLWQTLCDGEGIHGFYIPVAMVRDMMVLGVDTLRRDVEE